MPELVLAISGYRWERELQIIQADVLLEACGTVIIDEALCVDAGMPALAFSLHSDIRPNRWGEPEEWQTKPFFVCGCGDPECRAFSLAVTRDEDSGLVHLSELQEGIDGSIKVLEEFTVPVSEYDAAVRAAAEGFLTFVENLDSYKPLYGQTVQTVRRLLGCTPS
jgi:hypothetical protein